VSRRLRRMLAAVAIVALAVPVAVAGTASANPDQTPAHGRARNMGVCSPFLGQLGVRPTINQAIRDFGRFLPDGPYYNVGELYRIRAQEKPTDPADLECLPRDEDGNHQR
jgi:hypothetical protein